MPPSRTLSLNDACWCSMRYAARSQCTALTNFGSCSLCVSAVMCLSSMPSLPLPLAQMFPRSTLLHHLSVLSCILTLPSLPWRKRFPEIHPSFL